MTSIKEVFENKLKIDSKTVSIDSLFNNEDRKKNTNYMPSYQRNYVWDDEKASYFIESILLGTEIPPLIYFRNISKLEIIDGRQRYQTILRFLENDFKLKKSGLRKLSTKDFIGKNFDSLEKKYKDLIWETKLRIIEFSFNTKDGIDHIIEENVKKEIFKRYNSGITPLKTNEIDKAEYLYDNVNQYFKHEVLNDKRLLETIKLLFHFDRYNEEVLLKKIRELLVIDKIPIRYYSVKKNNITNQFYEYLYEDIESVDLNELKNTFITKINLLEIIYKKIKRKTDYNRIVSECLFWSLSIFHNENQHLLISNDNLLKISNYVDDNLDIYSMDRSSFALNIKNRYENISKIFSDLFEIKFDVYLKDSEIFNFQLVEINNSQENVEEFSFEDLRINKPEPSSTSIDDIVRLMKRQKFIIRPQYQRNEIIDRKKASSIIESILLGIKIPPIFVFKNRDGVSEVIDGQQRLLSILGFLGEDYINTENEFESTKKNFYSLNLRNSILYDLNSKKFSDLSTEYQEKIRNYDLWVVEIDAKLNDKFDPIDLFIRLNYKPYPIKIDSFEMWNSYISRELIDNIKDIYNNNRDWFYFRKNTPRMENENILTALIYLYFQFNRSADSNKSYEALDYYKVGNKINFRLKSKPDLTKALENDYNELIIASNLFEADFIKKLKFLVSFDKQKSLALNLDYLLCVDNGRRTQQALYALWYFLNELDLKTIIDFKEDIVRSIRNLFSEMNNVKSIQSFNSSVELFKRNHTKKYSQKIIEKISLENIATINKVLEKDLLHEISKKESGFEFIDTIKAFNRNCDIKRLKVDDLFDNKKIDKKIFDNKKIVINESKNIEYYDLFYDENKLLVNENYFILNYKRTGFSYEFLYLFLCSNFIINNSFIESRKLTKANLSSIEIPIIKTEYQNVFKSLYDLIIDENDKVIQNYFINIVNNINKFLINSSTFEIESINIFEILEFLSSEFKNQSDSKSIYLKLSDNNSILSIFILKMNYLLNEYEANN